MALFTGQLHQNQIFAAMFNMIIGLHTFANNISGTNSSLVDRNRIDGSLYGDSKIFNATDVLTTLEFGKDAEAINLLKLHRPPAPKQQEIVLDVFRQIPLTVDYYLTKQAWTDEFSFAEFTSVQLSWIRETKRVYDSTLYNSFIGTTKSTIGKQSQNITLPTNSDIEKQNRLQASAIAEALANLEVDLSDTTRDYNDYGFLRSLDRNEIVIVWNAAWVNKIKKIDLPTIYHSDSLFANFDNVLPARFFGNINASGGTTSSPNKTIRAAQELEFNSVDFGKPGYDPKKHCFPGDLLPASQVYDENQTYTEDGTIIFKIMHKDSVPMMSAFEVETSFFNKRSLTETHFLTWGHNTLEYLKNYPMITVTASVAAAASQKVKEAKA